MKAVPFSLCIAALLFALWLPTAAQTTPASVRPNIILIHADDLGWGDLGCYGQKNIATPRLDQLAREGRRFTQWYSGSTVCGPSRCCLLTGYHTGHGKIRGNKVGISLAEGQMNLGRALKAGGYQTACVGKWGLGNEDEPGRPLNQGFDHFMGYTDHIHAHNYYPEFLIKDGQRHILPNEVDPATVPKKMPQSGAGVARVKRIYAPDVILEDALAWLDARAGATGATPFFLHFTPTQPHANNEGKENGMEVPDLGSYASKDWPPMEKAKAAMITSLDSQVGALMDKLSALQLTDRTLIIFTSDNGPHKEGGANPDFHDSNGPLRGGKRDLYEGGIRVPMLMKWPGVVPAGTVDLTPAAHWDLFPTLATLAGVPVPSGLDGIDLQAQVKGTAESVSHSTRIFFWEFFEGQPGFAVRRGHHKLIHYPATSAKPQRTELYDLASDPGEATPLTDTALTEELIKVGFAQHTPSDEAAWSFAAATPSPTSEPGAPRLIDVFTSGTEGYVSIRIPSVVVTTKGTVLAFAEGRLKATDQAQNDIVMKSSRDGGLSWSPLKLLHDDGAHSLNNPTAVVDQATNRIFLIYQRIPGHLKEHSKDTAVGYEGENVYKNLLIWSDDDGQSWTAPLDITRSTKRPERATTICSGPGIGIQLTRGPHKGRLIFPFNEGPFWIWQNFAVYSDDGGKTWQYGEDVPAALQPFKGGQVRSLVNEVQMVELTDGSVRLDSRQFNGAPVRKTAVSASGGASWTPVSELPDLPDPSCMAGILRVSFDDGPSKQGHIIHTGPGAAGKRQQGMIYLSSNDGASWPVKRELYPGGFAYSVPTKLADGTLGCLFEADNYRRIVFARFSLDWVKGSTSNETGK